MKEHRIGVRELKLPVWESKSYFNIKERTTENGLVYPISKNIRLSKIKVWLRDKVLKFNYFINILRAFLIS